MDREQIGFVRSAFFPKLWLSCFVLVAFLQAPAVLAQEVPVTFNSQPDAETGPTVTSLDTITLRGSASESRFLGTDEENDPDINTLELDIPTLVQMVASKNLDVAAIGTQVDQAKGYLNQAIAGFFPSVRSQGYIEQLRGGDIFIGPVPFPVDRKTYQGRFSFDYNISLGGKALFNVMAAKNQLDRLKYNHNQTFQSALLETLEQYYLLLRDTSLVDVATQSLKEADAQLAYNKARFEAGFATKLDVAQSEVLQAQRKSELLQAENNREISAINLASILDMPLNFKLTVDRNHLKPVTFLDENMPLEHYYETALDLRQDVKEANEYIAEMKARFRSARADLLPTVSLSGYKRRIGQAWDETQETRQLFSSVSFDLLRNLGWDVISSMQIQKSKLKEVILQKQKKLNDIQKSLAKAYEDCKLYRAQMEVTAQKADAAFEAYKLAGSRLKEGFGLNLEVVQAQKDLTDARAEYSNAVMNFNNAQLRLLFESGQLTPHQILFTHQQVPLPQAPSVGTAKS